MMYYKKLTKAQAKELVESIDALPDAAFEDLKAKWISHNVDDFDDCYSDLREKVIRSYSEAADMGDYAVDLKVGFCLYTELNKNQDFTTVIANDDDIWRYLSCKVFPDITYLRYPKPAKDDIRIAKKRFYSHTRRIWLKTLWWYIHLSWQGTIASTYKVLKDCNVDTINKLYEQPGNGFRLILSRELMKQYSGALKKTSKLFESIQKQNLVNCRTIEPALTENAEKGYVEHLFNQLSLQGGS